MLVSWLPFPAALEEEYQSNFVMHFSRARGHAVVAAYLVFCTGHALYVGFSEVLSPQLAWAFLQYALWSWCVPRLSSGWRKSLAILSRLGNAVTLCTMPRIWGSLLEMPTKAKGVLTLSMALVVNMFQIFGPPIPLWAVLPTQMAITSVCLLLLAKSCCCFSATGALTEWITMLMPKIVNSGLRMMYGEQAETVNISTQEGCILVITVSHIFVGLVLMPFVIWHCERLSRKQFLNAIPVENKPRGVLDVKDISRTIVGVHCVVLLYASLCVIWEALSRSDIIELMTKVCD